MYRALSLLTILAFPFFLHAQKKSSSTVTGVVYDTTAKSGLAYATVSIVHAKDSTLVTFGRADSTGKFHLPSIEKGKYLLSASYVGYVPVWQPINVNEEAELNVGRVIMTDIVRAGNVTVMSKRPPVTINNDTLEFNTENFKTPPNAVVEDMLKKMPGITIDADGTVRVNGEKVRRVLVNGKEFFTGDPKLATKNLDADAVDKVQVFDKKSDRAEFTGIDDGQSEKAINLKLKKDRNNALFGKVRAGGGTDGRYETQATINKFKGDQQLSFIGMDNNTNRQGFSLSDVMNFTGDLAKGLRNGSGIILAGGSDNSGLPVTGQGQNQQGVAHTVAGGMNYNDSWKNKTDVNTSAVASDVDLFTNRNTNRQYLLPGSSTFQYDANSNAERHIMQQKWNGALDQKIDSFISFKLTPQVTGQQNDTRSFSDYTSRDNKGIILNNGTSDNTSHADALNISTTGLFKMRLRKKGRTLSSTIAFNYNDSKQNGSLNTRNTFYASGIPLPDSIVNQKNNQEGITRNFGGNLVYTEPVGKRSLFEFSGFYNTNVGESNRRTYDYNGSSGKYDQLNTLLSNDFKSEYAFGGGSLNFRTNQKQYNFTIGSSVQSAVLKSTNNSNGIVIQHYFTDVLPNANLQIKFSSSQNMRISYNTSTSQPSTVQLQPTLDVSDPLNTKAGNPDLKRSYTQSATISYFSANLYTQHNFFAFISANITDNAIVSSDIIQANGARLTTPVNANGNASLFGSISMGLPVKKLKSRFDFGLGTNYTRNISFINNAQNVITNKSIGPSFTWSFTKDAVVDIQATARLNISQADYSLQPAANSNYLQQTYGVDLTNYLPFGFIMVNNFNYTINSGRADGYNTQVPFWNVSMANSFLKKKRAELKFSVFDLLNRNIGISRNANQNYIEDTRYNVLQRYFLLTLTISLNKAGNTDAGAGGAKVILRGM